MFIFLISGSRKDIIKLIQRPVIYKLCNQKGITGNTKKKDAWNYVGEKL